MSRLPVILALALALLGASAPLQAEDAKRHYFRFQAVVEAPESRGQTPDEGGGASEAEFVNSMIASLDIAEARLDAIGGLAYQLDYQGGNQIGLVLYHENAAQIARDVFGIRSSAEFRLIAEDTAAGADRQSIADGDAPPGTEILEYVDDWGADAVMLDVAISGTLIESAAVNLDTYSGAFGIDLAFNEMGRKTLAEVTQAHVGERLAIVFEGRIVSAPVVHEPILGGKMKVNGGWTLEQANDLVTKLQAGASPPRFPSPLPLPFAIAVHRIGE